MNQRPEGFSSKDRWSDILRKKAKDISAELIAIRREIHQNPELGFEEIATSQIICKRLKELGIRFEEGIGKTGVVGLIEGKRGRGTVALRADMDGVPVKEETRIPYASKNPNVMHACGHDAHVACLLGAAKILISLKERFNGRVKLIFQPAEEIDSGAKAMISDGVLSDPKPDSIFALHVNPELDLGTIGLREGPMMAAIDALRISVLGKGGHAATPHQCVDAIVSASSLVMNLQTVVSRNTDPIKPVLISIGTISGGEADNIIASRVEMRGTVRTIDPDSRKRVQRIIKRVCKDTGEAFGARVLIDYKNLVPPLINSNEMTRRVSKSSHAILGLNSVKEIPFFMGGDDFSFFLQEIPGCYFFLGTKKPGSRVIHELHNGRFDIDERAIPLGAGILAHLALLSLEG